MDNRQWVYRYNNSLQDLCKFLMVWNCVINKNCAVWASASSQFLFMVLAVTKHFRTYRIRSPVVISIHLSGCENISGFFTILFSHYFYCFLIYKHPQICYYFERSEIIVFAEYKQTQRTREYICWPHYREFPGGNFRFPWLRGKCRRRWKMAWERCSRDTYWCRSNDTAYWNGEFSYCSDCNRTACYSGRVSGQRQIITEMIGMSDWNRTRWGFWPRGRNEQKW